MVEVALFPIPNLVAFPGSAVPLHVFEPRYRRMIHESVESERMIGVCHTRKVIREAPADQSVDEALSSNQSTYQPYEIFSAGPCEIIEVLPDGRLHAIVDTTTRLRLIEDIQVLPYRIVRAEEVEDESEDTDIDAIGHRINDQLRIVAEAHSPELMALLDTEAWQALTARELSFRVYQFLRAEPDFMQEILETRLAGDRLRIADQILSRIA